MSADSRDGLEMMSRRDARELFEQSLQRLTRANRADVESPELMHLLLTTGPVCASGGDGDGHLLTAASSGAFIEPEAVQDADLDARKNVATCSSTSTAEHKVCDTPAHVSDDRTSVFTSDRLDEYLAKDGISDTSAGESRPGDVQDMDVERSSWTDSETGRPQDSSGSYTITPETSSDGRTTSSDMQVDIIDGFSFCSFSTAEALLRHVDDSSEAWRTAGQDAGGSRTKKFQYGIAGNMAKYLAKMKGWEKRTSTASDQLADALDALLSDGMVRQVSDGVVLGLNLGSAADDNDDTVIPAVDGGRAAVGRYPRRGVGKMGNEERQPRKGRIYGRKFDGRFASKANIHYHIKRRRSPTTPYSAVAATTESSSHRVSSCSYSGLSRNCSQSLTTQQNISRLLQLHNLQPRVDLTKAIIPLRTSAAKDVDRLPPIKLRISCKNKTVVKSSDHIYLTRLTEAAARRAVVALQLAPSMTNSPMKCNKPSTSVC